MNCFFLAARFTCSILSRLANTSCWPLNNAFLLVLSCSCGLLVPRVVHSQTGSKAAELDSLLVRAHRIGMFNGNVLVASNGKVIYQRALGQADASGAIPLTEAHRFAIGSIAKEFNAVGIMMLKEQGKLRLEDPIRLYLPELPAWAAQVQVRHLLQYTSGIPQSPWREVTGDADNLRRLQKVTALDFAPGTKYAYNNNDVFLQRRIIERLTSLSFAAFVQKKMLRPCHITHAVVDPTAQDPLVARAYSNQGVAAPISYPITGWPALNLRDFYRWSESINSFKLISPAATGELFQPFAPGTQTGLGGGAMTAEQVARHVHDGTLGNYQALLFSNPASAITVLLLTNNKQNNLPAINQAIAAVLEGKPYAAITKSFLGSFRSELTSLDGQQVLSLYAKVKAQQPTLYGFGQEELLNETGYYLLGQKKIADAIVVLAYNTTLFPTSANAFDSLAEGYYQQGDKAKALENYSQALKLNPNLASAKKMLAELTK